MSLWIPLAVFLSVMALLIALLPVTSAAKADENVGEESPLSDLADQLEALNDQIVIEELETLSEGPEGTPLLDDAEQDALSEQVASDPALQDEDSALVGEESLLVAALNAIMPAQALPPREVDHEVVATGFVGPAGQDGNVYLGDTVTLNGTWRATSDDQPLQAGDYFYIDIPDPPLRIVDNPMDIISATGFVWGTCEAEVAESRYRCEFGSDMPADTYETFGTWGALAIAAELGDGIIEPPAGTFGVSKVGRMGYDQDWVGDNPAGTIIEYRVALTSDNWDLITQDIVLRDTFDSKLRLCEEGSIRVTQDGEILETEFSIVDANEFVLTIKRPAAGFDFNTDIAVRYYLCTVTGGMEEKGTLYNNSIEAGGGQDSEQVEQERTTWIDADRTESGSFTLDKVVDADSVPAGYDPAGDTFTVLVEEFNREGVFQTSYPLTIQAGADEPIRGLNVRPAGWTIRISEVGFPNAPP